MSSENTQNQVSALLERLDNAIGRKNKVGNGGGKKDWAAINAARKAAFWKPKEGKNTILVLTPTFGSDPFTFWGFHKGLQEVDYYSVPCDHYNKAEDCLVCNIVKGLKEDGWEANKHLWMPIEQKTETYAPIIDFTTPASIAEGPKWFRISKTIMDQIINNIKNLEDGELPFYDETAPQRLIINYDKNTLPAQMYNVELKPLKEIPSAEQFAEWKSKINPVGDYIFSKSQEEIKKIVDEYFVRVASELDQAEEVNAAEDTSAPFDGGAEADASPAVSKSPAKSKLDKLKK